MPTNFFLMDNGGGFHTTLWRREVKYSWRDAPTGKGELEFKDDNGHPCDVFGQPLDEEFVESFPEKC